HRVLGPWGGGRVAGPTGRASARLGDQAGLAHLRLVDLLDVGFLVLVLDLGLRFTNGAITRGELAIHSRRDREPVAAHLDREVPGWLGADIEVLVVHVVRG